MGNGIKGRISEKSDVSGQLLCIHYIRKKNRKKGEARKGEISKSPTVKYV